jgi:Protein of unknown function (DUF3617)
MNKAVSCLVLACCICAGATIAEAGTRKAGLWEVSTTLTWQKPPTVPGADGDRLKGTTHTSQVCLTQEMIDKYGALLPRSRGQCTIENKVVEPGSITADYVCTGMMRGKGALRSTWSDPEHSAGEVHFVGTLQDGPVAQPVEWTTKSTSVFKSADCSAARPSP